MTTPDPRPPAERTHTFLTDQPLEVDELRRRVDDPTCGATVIMTGQVRDHHQGRPVERLLYQAYDEMATEVLDILATETVMRWPQVRVVLAHRTGMLEIGEISVVVAVAAPHREEAFTACRWCIDTLKQRLPVWKAEHGPEGRVWQEEDPL
jgi:molybdopterin synthase catalytic subunit